MTIRLCTNMDPLISFFLSMVSFPYNTRTMDVFLNYLHIPTAKVAGEDNMNTMLLCLSIEILATGHVDAITDLCMDYLTFPSSGWKFIAYRSQLPLPNWQYGAHVPPNSLFSMASEVQSSQTNPSHCDPGLAPAGKPKSKVTSTSPHQSSSKLPLQSCQYGAHVPPDPLFSTASAAQSSQTNPSHRDPALAPPSAGKPNSKVMSKSLRAL
jgi:hypothetical protein